jgi:hypothetical protein
VPQSLRRPCLQKNERLRNFLSQCATRGSLRADYSKIDKSVVNRVHNRVSKERSEAAR